MSTAPAMSEAEAALDRVLDAFERGRHTATEMRLLLRLVDRHDAGIRELADQLGSRPIEVTRAGRRLAMRGLVRTHRAGRGGQTLMEITPSGLATVRTLLNDGGFRMTTRGAGNVQMGIDAHGPSGKRRARSTA
jgi:DNA-binding MarR family transcriptional regulator